ncbi:MAG: citramalate synthase [Clostridiales bacterium]|jgi:2-isopropylmalate synthase|nr:citramalate synthase [Clostridiales bacterium]
MGRTVTIYDSTLRDGAQAEGVSFSVEDKLKIVRALDDLGAAFIEAGNPASNPKDLEFFARVKHLELRNAKIAAFGSTRRKDLSAVDDKNLQLLLSADTAVTAVFGKCWDFHVTDILQASLEENLNMIRDTVSFLKARNREVFFDAEHFFDGYKANPAYAFDCLKAAAESGADCLVLCDTNGGAFPTEIHEITKRVTEEFSLPVGIHCHNDGGMAAANSFMAVEAGASQVQGTFTGFGERCGNVALATVIANLQIKRGYLCVSPEKLHCLTKTARLINEVANLWPDEAAPYVGRSAFAHKGGMHIDAVLKSPRSFEHIEPDLVGNTRKTLTSEVAGRGAILTKIQRINPNITKDSPETESIIQRVKELEHEGYQFEAAEGALELIIRKQLGKYRPLFELINFKIVGEQPYVAGRSATAMIKINVDGTTEITAAEGDGPVNALDKALRKALEVFYPQIAGVRLTDYKVRVMDGKSATASRVRVLIESTDGAESWSTVGVSTDIIEASWIALVDSVEYKLIRDIENRFRAYL